MKSTVRVGVVGCGGWGRNLVRNFAELGALVAVADQDEARVTQLAATHAVPAVPFSAMIVDTAIDAVVIATPPATHAALAIAALEAGKHVFVEKPLALDVADAERIVAAAQAARRTLMVGHLLQYHPAFLALKQLVDEGTLGRLLHLDSTRLNFGKIRREENSLWSFAPHDLSMILALVGAEPERIGAVGSSFLNHDIADVTTTHLAFPGGQTALAHVSWLNPVKVQRLTVIGDRAMAVFDDSEPWTSKLRLYRHEVRWQSGTPVPHKAEAEAIALEEAEPLALECAHFLASVADGTLPRTGGEEGLRVLRVLAAAQFSMADPLTRPATPQPSTGQVGDGPGSKVSADVQVHPTATIDPGVQIGAGSRIWHYSHILSGSILGRDCTVGQNVMIGPDVRVGDGCRIQNNVSLYAGVRLEQDVFCGPSAVFTNVRTPRAGYDRRGEFAPTIVRRGATIGANATIVCGNTLGANCTVGAGAVVTRDIPDHALVVGNPARQIGWVSHAGERLGDDLVCPRTADRYALEDDRLVRVSEGVPDGR
jgi:predicted dehydrogenase/acetyltransferase-like isoleucine patch superfamily enzyme